jgi:drug/metabolite transporter (DMT)-like permease
VLWVAQAAGALGAFAVAVVRGERLPGAEGAAWALVAGVFGSIGLAALYRGLASGRMAVVAPISGLLAAAIPVALGIAVAGAPGALRIVGFALGLASVVLVSASVGGDTGSEGGPHRPAESGGVPGRGVRTGVALGLVAGVVIGGYNIAIARIDPNAIFGSLAISRGVAAVIAIGLGAAARVDLAPPRSLLPALIAIGCLDVSGNAAYVVAAQIGRLDVAALLASLYPVTTVILAAVVLRERVTRLQVAAIAGAGLAIVLIVSG